MKKKEGIHMNKNRVFIVLSALAMVASCGTPKSEAKLSFHQAEGTYVFPIITPFDDSALPEISGKIVAFCPVSTGYTNVYNWVTASGQPAGSFDSWPGKAMSEKYNEQWWKCEYEGYSNLNIIFNKGNGGAQTADMAMTHEGYWWFWESDKTMHDSVPEGLWIDQAKFLDEDTIRLVTSVKMNSFKLYEGENVILSGSPDGNAIDIEFGKRDFDLSEGDYRVEAELENGTKTYSKVVDISALYATDKFNAQFAYYGNDLGAVYSAEKTTFKVWSPFSTSIKLKLYANGTPTSIDDEKGSDAVYKEVDMVKGDKGVWSAVVEEDLDGYYYTYTVTNSTFNAVEIVDPYAKGVGVNGKRGMILDLARTNPEGWDEISPHQYEKKSLVVWETHIADLTSSPTWTGTESGRKKYAGFHEAGTTYTKDGVTVKTGFDHVKEMGVNAVQIIPFFDQDNDETNMSFNWGYNPLNYNAPEGGYSSDPYHGEVRIKELKELIRDYSEAGINIIMDVVYNHVSSSMNSNFNVLMPGYYFRLNADGSFSNGSGCGNETASNHYMFRKFMIDSTTYWAREYKLGGFRFDLMGLHDVETMNELTSKCKEINPNICIYGEPWMGGTSTNDYTSAKQSNGNLYEGYGQFNDGLRDGLIKGGLNPSSAKGWSSDLAEGHKGDLDQVTKGIMGTTLSDGTIADPDKTVNYVTCHDNYTLYDRLNVNWSRKDYQSYIKNMALLSESIVMTSQGTSFMLAGDEFMRTKGGCDNSYGGDPLGNLAAKGYKDWYEVNTLDWGLKVEHKDMVEKFKKLIELKVKVDGLHLDKAGVANFNINSNEAGNLIWYEVRDSVEGKTYKIAHQAPWTVKKQDGVLVLNNPSTVDFSGYTDIYLDTLDNSPALNGAVTLGIGETLIAVK